MRVMSHELRALHTAIAPQYDEEAFARCECCRVSVLQEPLYWFDVCGRMELRCHGCSGQCAECGVGVAVVHVLGTGKHWSSCAECAQRVDGLRCGATIWINLPPAVGRELTRMAEVSP